MRRSLTLLATVAILIGLVAAPAAADKPAEFTWEFQFPRDNPDFPVIDPCTGEDMIIDVQLVIREHQGHPNNLTRLAKGYGTTSSGYVLSGSPDHFMENDKLLVNTFSDMWRNPGTGAKMHMLSVFVMKDGEVQVDRWETWCVGGPTIDPDS
jgi:hypothetical protein